MSFIQSEDKTPQPKVISFNDHGEELFVMTSDGLYRWDGEDFVRVRFVDPETEEE